MTAWARSGRCLALILLLACAAVPAPAEETRAPAAGASEMVRRAGASGLPLPRFVSLRAPEVNLRTGPGVRYPIDWVYRRPGLPIEIVEEFETWRRIRDWEGSLGWVHQSMLSGERRVLVLERERLLRREPAVTAPGVAVVEPGVIGRLQRCKNGWCELEVKGFEGWLAADEIYGVYPGETLE